MKVGSMWINFTNLTTGLDNQPWEQGYIEGDCILFLFAWMGMMWRRQNRFPCHLLQRPSSNINNTPRESKKILMNVFDFWGGWGGRR